MKKITIEDLRSWNPCYDPARHLPEGWEGTALDILKMDNVGVSYRLWVVLKPEVLPEIIIKRFALWAARRVRHLMKDPRSVKVLDIAEKYINGEASYEEMRAAEAAAEDAWNAAAIAAGCGEEAAALAVAQAAGAAVVAAWAARSANASWTTEAVWTAWAAGIAARRDAEAARAACWAVETARARAAGAAGWTVEASEFATETEAERGEQLKKLIEILS